MFWPANPTGQLAQPINTSHWFIQLSFNPWAVNHPIHGWAWLVKPVNQVIKSNERTRCDRQVTRGKKHPVGLRV